MPAGVVGRIDLGTILEVDFVKEIIFFNYEIYDVELPGFDFVVITQFPRAVNSILGVFTPFNAAIWWSILTSCVCISIILQFEDIGQPNNFDVLRSIKDYVTVQSLLFGQSLADEVLKNVKHKRISRPLWAVWFLACYVLMENLYQGSIYSDLTVRVPPTVPKTFEDLIAADLTIITSTPIYMINQFTGRVATPSLLNQSMILDILKKNVDKRFDKWEENLDAKIIYINRDIEYVIPFVKNISNFLPFRLTENSSWIDTKETFAIMDSVKDLQLWTEVLNIFGKRLVMLSKAGDSSFRYSSVTSGYQNFISPKIKSSLQHMTQSGILARYNILDKTMAKLRYEEKIEQEDQSKFGVKLGTKVTGAAVAGFKSGLNKDESLGALLHVLALCSIVVLVATIVLVCEKLVWYEKVRKERIRKRIELRRDAFTRIKVMGTSPLFKEFLTSD